MKKKIIALFAAVIMVLCLGISNASAVGENVTYEYLDDGSYYVYEVTDNDSGSLTRASTTKTKTKKLYIDDTLQWTVAVAGVFSYDGTTCTCTSVAHSYSISNDDWVRQSQTSYKTANKAVTNATMKDTENNDIVEVQVVLTCDANGNAS